MHLVDLAQSCLKFPGKINAPCDWDLDCLSLNPKTPTFERIDTDIYPKSTYIRIREAILEKKTINILVRFLHLQKSNVQSSAEETFKRAKLISNKMDCWQPRHCRFSERCVELFTIQCEIKLTSQI